MFVLHKLQSSYSYFRKKMAFIYSDDDFPVLSPENNGGLRARRRFLSSDSDSDHSDLPPRQRPRLNYTSDEDSLSSSDVFDLASQDVRIYLYFKLV